MRVYKEKNRGKSASVYTVAITDQHGKRRKFAGFADKASTQELGRKLERLVATRVAGRNLDAELTDWLEQVPPALSKRLVNLGLLDPARIEAAGPLMIAKAIRKKQASSESLDVTGGHLADYQRHMRSRELAPQHIHQVVSHCARMFDRTKMRFPSDITTNRIECYLSDLRQSGASARTANCALAAVKSFCNWMVREGRMQDNPATRVGLLNEKADRRIVRRALSTEEAKALIRYTIAGPAHHNCSGVERALVYRLALSTGLRWNEIRTLEQSDFHLDESRPFVQIDARHEKAKRGAVLPLTGDERLAVDLARFFADRPINLFGESDRLAFPGLPSKGAKMLREDLAYARRWWRMERYRDLRRTGMERLAARLILNREPDTHFLQPHTPLGKVDFHALRHTFGTWLARSGVHPKVCQEMMRHANIETTMQLYTHTLIEDKDKAARALRGMTGWTDEGETNTRATIPA